MSLGSKRVSETIFVKLRRVSPQRLTLLSWLLAKETFSFSAMESIITLPD